MLLCRPLAAEAMVPASARRGGGAMGQLSDKLPINLRWPGQRDAAPPHVASVAIAFDHRLSDQWPA
jgi:hypothetical protein